MPLKDLDESAFWRAHLLCGLVTILGVCLSAGQSGLNVVLSLACGWGYAALSIKFYAALIRELQGDRSYRLKGALYLAAKIGFLILFFVKLSSLSNRTFWFILAGFLLIVPAALASRFFVDRSFLCFRSGR